MPAPTAQATQDQDDNATLGPRDGERSRGRRPVLDGYVSDEELATELDVSVRTLGRWDAQYRAPSSSHRAKAVLPR